MTGESAGLNGRFRRQTFAAAQHFSTSERVLTKVAICRL